MPSFDRFRSAARGWAERHPRLGRAGGRLGRYFRALGDRRLGVGKRLLYLVGGLAALFVAVALLIFLYALLLYPFTPGIAELKEAKVERPAVVLSARGEEIVQFRRLNRRWVPLDEISPHVVHALIDTEDHRFYEHGGLDLRRTASALVLTLLGDRQGGSTIPQQLARNLYPDEIGRSISLTRKLKEIITALKIEAVYSKDEILETYLNTVPFLYNAFGIEMAARTYFDKPAKRLDVLESATLVGMLKGTAYYNPVRNPERSTGRRNTVLRQMVKHGHLTREEYERLQDDPIDLDFERQPANQSQAPHFTEYVRRWLIEWADRHDYNLYADGLVVHTTLDLRLQRMAQRAVQQQGRMLQAAASREWGPGAWRQRATLVNALVRGTAAFERGVRAGVPEEEMLDSLRASDRFMDSLRTAKTRLEAGFVAIDPTTGAVRAWVGSRDFEKDQFDHVSRARRQPGSTFKPFVYAAALENGFSPQDRFVDREVEIPLDGRRVWRPTNSDGVSGREMTLAEGLARSKNTITAQVMHEVGPRRVVALARRAGIRQSKLQAVPSLALGTSEVTLFELVNAYATFASGGVHHEPLLVTRIEDRDGNVLATFEPESRRALSERVALTVIDMLRGVVDFGTGQRVRTTFGIRADVAGKTGTTQDNADGWFVLMHPDLVAGAWVGFNDPRIAFRSNYWGQGAHNALYLVGDFFRQALRSRAVGLSGEFPPAPDFEGGGSVFDRLGRWFSDRFGGDGEAPDGEEDQMLDEEELEPEPERRDRVGWDQEPEEEAPAEEEPSAPDSVSDFPPPEVIEPPPPREIDPAPLEEPEEENEPEAEPETENPPGQGARPPGRERAEERREEQGGNRGRGNGGRGEGGGNGRGEGGNGRGNEPP